MLSVSWMHLGFLDEMQLYDLAFRVCARLGSLQTLLPVYHNALQHYMSLVRPDWLLQASVQLASGGALVCEQRCMNQ